MSLASESAAAPRRAVSSATFVNEYHGHTLSDLSAVHAAVRHGADGSRRGIVYLAGDSSLDNKHWLLGGRLQAACNGYESVLSPPRTAADIAWAVNRRLQDSGLPLVCINGAIEESTISDRHKGRLMPQDVWIRDHITADDVLIVSVGGNDIALRPSAATVACIGSLVKLSSDAAIESGSAWGLGHFVSLFRDDVAAYLDTLTAKCRPRLIILCMIYYPHEAAGEL